MAGSAKSGRQIAGLTMAAMFDYPEGLLSNAKGDKLSFQPVRLPGSI